jgi:hypothetical protein
MRSIETKAYVTTDGKLHIELETDMSPGEHSVVLVFNEELGTIAYSQRKLNIPGSYRPTSEQIEARLRTIFKPEEIALIGTTDFNKVSFGSKSLSQMVIEDREDRF